MSNKIEYFLNKSLGEDFLESLAKTDIWKPDTRTVSNLEDMRVGLKIVPRAVMSMLISELTPMKIGETKDIDLPLPNGARFHVMKHEKDQYSGEVFENNERLTEFKFRSIPGVGLVIMSTFELYNMESDKTSESSDIDESRVQKLIDDRLALHRMVENVVDGKLREKDAIQKMLLNKLTDAIDTQVFDKKKSDISELTKISKETAPMSDPYFRGMANGLEVANATVNDVEPNFVEAPKKKTSPIKTFLENKKKKNEFSVQMTKSETVACDTCGKALFDNFVYSGCVCMGENMDSKIFMTKSEDSVKVRFTKNWTPENIAMLLETLRNRK